MTDLSKVSTRELVEELIKREGVSEEVVEVEEFYEVGIKSEYQLRHTNSTLRSVSGEGPARILVVID